MTDLIPDLTAATEGSRDLSDRVLLALGWVDGTEIDAIRDDEYGDGEIGVSGWWIRPDGDRVRLYALPNPTVNLQDAVDLVPADAWWVLNSGTRGAATALMPQFIEEIGNTPQLALCVALLKYMEKT